MDVKRNGGFCYGRKLWTPSFLQSNGHLKRQFLSSDFLDQQAPTVCALKYHVGCKHITSFGDFCATCEASINRESKCCFAGRRIQEFEVGWVGGKGGQESILKMKLAGQKKKIFFFFQNRN